MGDLVKHKQWRKYDDYRVRQYCIIECPKCHIDRNNMQAFCWGKFEDLRTGKRYNGAGVECDKIIDFCFNENIKTIE